MNVYFRKDLDDIVNFMLYDDDSSESDDEWSTSDDDKDLLLVDKLFPENPSLHVLIPKKTLRISVMSNVKCCSGMSTLFSYTYIKDLKWFGFVLYHQL